MDAIAAMRSPHLLLLCFLLATVATFPQVETTNRWNASPAPGTESAARWHAGGPAGHHCVVAVGISTASAPSDELAARELRRYTRAVTSRTTPVALVRVGQVPLAVPPECGDAVSHVVVTGRCAALQGLVDPRLSREARRAIFGRQAADDAEGGMQENATAPHPDAHLLIKTSLGTVPTHVTCGVTGVGTLYAAYAFAERMGVRFYPHGDVLPEARPSGPLLLTPVPVAGEALVPDFDVRGANTWGTWTEGFDWWTSDNWRGFVTQLVKMRCNFIGMHSYPAEPSVWVGTRDDLYPESPADVIPGKAYPSSYTTTLKKAYSYVPTPTSAYSGGASSLFPEDCCCGVNIGQPPSGSCPVPETAAARAQVLDSARDVFAAAFSWASQFGVRTALGSESPLQAAGGNVTASAEL